MILHWRSTLYLKQLIHQWLGCYPVKKIFLEPRSMGTRKLCWKYPADIYPLSSYHLMICLMRNFLGRWGCLLPLLWNLGVVLWCCFWRGSLICEWGVVLLSVLYKWHTGGIKRVRSICFQSAMSCAGIPGLSRVVMMSLDLTFWYYI